jgi:transcriptional regulator with XRE-family HTH domain
MTSEQFVKWRKSLGWTQKQAATALGYEHRATISQFENGHTKISARVEILCDMISQRNRRATK